jgi:hypothetical protein
MFCSRIFPPTPSIVVDGWLGAGARVIFVKPMPASSQHTGIAAHHIIERCIFLMVRVPGLSGIACMVGTVLAAMIGVAPMRPAVVDVLSDPVAAGSAIAATAGPWGPSSTCGAARAAAAAAAAAVPMRPWVATCGAARAAAVAAGP